MALLSPADQDKLRTAFTDMTRPVRLLFFTQTLECETCPLTRQILDELPALSDKIAIDEINIILDRDKARQYGIDRAPGIALLYEDHEMPPERGEESRGEASVGEPGAMSDSRIRFLGAPAGYEFMSLVQAVLLVGGRPSALTEESRARLAAVNAPVTMQVFTTPT